MDRDEEKPEDLGVMLYGYDRERALEIGELLSITAGKPVKIIGASGCEARTVMEVIEGEGDGTFGDCEPKILMFLGFDDDRIESALEAFPRGPARPIFCTLTESNIGWKMSDLLEHLLEEKRAWEERKALDRVNEQT